MLNFLKRNSKNERQVVKSEWTRNILGFSMKQKCLTEMKGKFYFIFGQKVKSFLTVEILKLIMLTKFHFTSPVPQVFHTVVTVNIGLKNVLRVGISIQ